METLSALPGVGEKRLAALHDAGLVQAEDLILRLPSAYRDYTVTHTVCTLEPGMRTVFFAALKKRPSITRTGKLSVLSCVFADDTGEILARSFNQPYLLQTLSVGQKYAVYAHIERVAGKCVAQSPMLLAAGELGTICPVYPPVAGVPNKTYRKLVQEALRRCDVPELLPELLRQKAGVCSRKTAYLQAHFPDDRASLMQALYALRVEGLLLYQLKLRFWRSAVHAGVAFDARGKLGPLLCRLPFALTGAQVRVVDEILTDLAAPAAMARLVQGDVGSGKTAVALCALYACVISGYQGAMMAPTEVLAKQHYDACRKIFEPLGISVGLLVGAMSPKAHRSAYQAIESGAWQVVIGTHALITGQVRFARLGLAITDEQHRFGVRQRTLLGQKGAGANVLVMSATPIPRSLTLTLFGDLAVSVLDELPPGRKAVKTYLVPEHKRAGMYGFLRTQVQLGRQGYVVCPLIEKNDELGLLSAQESFARLTEALPELRISMVHGLMKSREKEAVLAQFYLGQTDILVSTTVIEVGVNVPNASFMVIEDAGRFGLAQLHQLRGRVGRGRDEAYCFLMADNAQKLRILAQTNDGFVIAQKDLELRGPGDLAGTRQSGAFAETAGQDLQTLALVRELAAYVEQQREDPQYAALWQLAAGEAAQQGVN